MREPARFRCFGIQAIRWRARFQTLLLWQLLVSGCGHRVCRFSLDLLLYLVELYQFNEVSGRIVKHDPSGMGIFFDPPGHFHGIGFESSNGVFQVAY